MINAGTKFLIGIISRKLKPSPVEPPPPATPKLKKITFQWDDRESPTEAFIREDGTLLWPQCGEANFDAWYGFHEYGLPQRMIISDAEDSEAREFGPEEPQEERWAREEQERRACRF